jgi:hypothetical protein
VLLVVFPGVICAGFGAREGLRVSSLLDGSGDGGAALKLKEGIGAPASRCDVLPPNLPVSLHATCADGIHCTSHSDVVELMEHDGNRKRQPCDGYGQWGNHMFKWMNAYFLYRASHVLAPDSTYTRDMLPMAQGTGEECAAGDLFAIPESQLRNPPGAACASTCRKSPSVEVKLHHLPADGYDQNYLLYAGQRPVFEELLRNNHKNFSANVMLKPIDMVGSLGFVFTAAGY